MLKITIADSSICSEVVAFFKDNIQMNNDGIANIQVIGNRNC